MIEFCLSVFILICSHLEFFGTRILFYVFWSEDDSLTRIDAVHPQGWTLNILILLHSGLNFEFWFSSTLNPSVKALWSIRSTWKCVNADWMIELCLSVFTANLLAIWILWDKDTSACILIRNVSWTRIDAEHPQGWMLNILILLHSGLNFVFWFSSTLNPYLNWTIVIVLMRTEW